MYGMNKPKKLFFTNHSKSSAALLSIALHLILLLIADTFVAVTVLTKGKKKFICQAEKVSAPMLCGKRLIILYI